MHSPALYLLAILAAAAAVRVAAELALARLLTR